MPCLHPSGRCSQRISVRIVAGVDLALVEHANGMSGRKLCISMARAGGSLISGMLKGLGWVVSVAPVPATAGVLVALIASPAPSIKGKAPVAHAVTSNGAFEEEGCDVSLLLLLGAMDDKGR